MRPQYHTLISIIISIPVYFLTNSFTAAFLCILAGIFVDIDHLPDYWLYRRKMVIDRKFFTQDYHVMFGRIFVILHCFEFVLVMLIIYNMTKYTPIIGAIVGYTAHLITDSLTNGVHPLTYFLTYRLIKKFDTKILLEAPRWKKNKSIIGNQ